MTLDEAIKRFSGNAEYERTHGSLQGCLEFRQLVEWLTELKESKEQTGWIPVSERLPEDGEMVFVTYGNFVIRATWDLMRYSFYDTYATRLDKDLVYAWMPSPEPYKVESEGK